MKIKLAGIKIDNVSLEESQEKLHNLVQSKKPSQIVTPNPEIIVAAQNDSELREIVNNAALCLPDGISMVVVSKILGNPFKERVAGIDFMMKSIVNAERLGYKIFLLGGEPGISATAAQKLKKQFPKLIIIGAENGYFKDEQLIIDKIRSAKPDILFVGLGAGRQERWIAKNLTKLNVPVCVGVGGAMDVISGNKSRAPKIIQMLYIEWLYRLFKEPWRWKRQLALPKFLWFVFFQAGGFKRK